MIRPAAPAGTPRLRLTEEAFVTMTADNLRRLTRGDPARIRALIAALNDRALAPDDRRALASDPRGARALGPA